MSQIFTLAEPIYSPPALTIGAGSPNVYWSPEETAALAPNRPQGEVIWEAEEFLGCTGYDSASFPSTPGISSFCLIFRYRWGRRNIRAAPSECALRPGHTFPPVLPLTERSKSPSNQGQAEEQRSNRDQKEKYDGPSQFS